MSDRLAVVKSYIFHVELEQEDDERWSATVPALAGCAAWGYTSDEAIERVQELAKAYVEVLIEDGRPIPTDEEAGMGVLEGAAVSVVT